MAMASNLFSRLSLAPSPAPASHLPPLRLSSRPLHSCSLKFSNLFLGESLAHGALLCRPVILPITRRPLVTVGAVTKKPDSAAKRARQAEKSRIYNKARKSEIHTRMKKVFLALDGLKKQKEPSPDTIAPIETMIAEAYSVIDKAVKVGTIPRNRGAHRKSRLARAKKAVEIQLGWYTPTVAA